MSHATHVTLHATHVDHVTLHATHVDQLGINSIAAMKLLIRVFYLRYSDPAKE